MAKLSGVYIADKNSNFDCGAAFLLKKKPEDNILQTVDGNSEVELKSNSPYIVSRTKGAKDSVDAYTLGTEVAQKGLDLISIQGKSDLIINSLTSEYLVWWRKKKKQYIRAVSVIEIGINTFPPDIIALDSKGNPHKEVELKPNLYNESFYFYRMSQTSDDLFDSYRNLYLAFESLISHKYPKNPKQKMKSNG